MFVIFFLILSVFAEEPSHTIVVEAHKDMELYVAPIKVKNVDAKHIEAVIGDYSVFGYASSHNRMAKVKIDGSIKPLQDITPRFKVFNEDTIKYSWDNCDYIKDAKACSYKNNHYLLETHITVDKHQIVVEMFLFDQDLQIISTGSRSSDIKIYWIRQQEVTVTQNQGLMGSSTTIHKPKEELPLKWEIPYKLLQSHVQQSMLGLWLGIKID